VRVSRSHKDLNIVVGRHTIQFGHQVVQLRNVARISLIMFDARPMSAFVRLLAELIIGVIVIGILCTVLPTDPELFPFPVERLETLGLTALFALVAIYLARLVSLASRDDVHVFAMDITGGSCITLSSHDKRATGRLMDLVRNAIEYPPEVATVHRIDNIHIGDRIKQFGNGNRIEKQVLNA
jgi:Family of unknown function (DUF6232)